MAIICDVLGKANNGTTITTLNLITFLKQAGHDVRVVCPDAEKEGEIGWFIVPKRNFGIFNSYVKKNNVELAKADKKILQTAIENCDCVHAIMPFSLGKTAVQLAHKKGIPVTCGFHCQAENITCHFGLHTSQLASTLVYRIFYTNFYRYAAAIHYPTEFIRYEFEHAIKKRKTHGFIISNGVNPIFMQQKAKTDLATKHYFTIVFAGRLSREKEHHVLIDAVKKSRHEKSIRLIFAGSGPLKKKLLQGGKRLTNSLQIDFYSREKLADLFCQADLYCHPASVEIEAISCLEAISCGLVPIIADSAKSATKYFALHKNNLFKSGDSTDLAQKIDYWIDNPQARRHAQAEYKDYSTQFQLTVCMDAMEKMFYSVLRSKAEPVPSNTVLHRITQKINSIKRIVFAFFILVILLNSIQIHAKNNQSSAIFQEPSQNKSAEKNAVSDTLEPEYGTVKDSASSEHYKNLVLKMYVSPFYNVPSYWFEAGTWQEEKEYTQVFGNEDEIISPYQLNMIKNVRYYCYTARHPLDPEYHLKNKDFFSRFRFYRFKGKTLLPHVDVHLFALDIQTNLLFSYALPAHFDKVWGNYVPRNWIPLEKHPYIKEHFPDTAFYQFDPIGYVCNDGKIALYEWITTQNAQKNKNPLVNYLPRLDNNAHTASMREAGCSPYKLSDVAGIKQL